MFVLHIGNNGKKVPPEIYPPEEWTEYSLDVSPAHNPNYLCSILNIDDADEVFDGIYCSHVLEHLWPHEVVPALKECRRVLKPGKRAIFHVPDLEVILKLAAEHGLDYTLYEASGGTITCADVIWGHKRSLAEGHLSMAHKTGFTSETLTKAFADAGFSRAQIIKSTWDLTIIAE